jgi:hypothetical protein
MLMSARSSKYTDAKDNISIYLRSEDPTK